MHEEASERKPADSINYLVNSPPTTPDKATTAGESTGSANETDPDRQELSSNETPPWKVRSLRNIYETCSFALNVADPTSYEEFVKDEVLRKALKWELAATERHNTWKLVSLPKGKKIMGFKRIYKIQCK